MWIMYQFIAPSASILKFLISLDMNFHQVQKGLEMELIREKATGDSLENTSAVIKTLVNLLYIGDCTTQLYRDYNKPD